MKNNGKEFFSHTDFKNKISWWNLALSKQILYERCNKVSIKLFLFCNLLVSDYKYLNKFLRKTDLVNLFSVRVIEILKNEIFFVIFFFAGKLYAGMTGVHVTEKLLIMILCLEQ